MINEKDGYFIHNWKKKNFEKTLFIVSGHSGERALQAAELNEVEDRIIQNRTLLADSIFTEGDVVQGSVEYRKNRVYISEDCMIYAGGSIRPAPGPSEGISIDGGFPCIIGLKKVEQIVEGEAASDPYENNKCPGAMRLVVRYEYTTNEPDIEVFKYVPNKPIEFAQISKLRDISKIVSSISQFDFIVAKDTQHESLHDVLKIAEPGSEILVKSPASISTPYVISKSDIRIKFAPAATVEASDLDKQEVEKNRAVFIVKADRVLIEGGFLYTKRKPGRELQVLNLEGGVTRSPILSNVFFDTSTISKNSNYEKYTQ